MSTDAFAPAIFPRLLPPESEAEHEQARVRGYAEGHAEGYRAGLALAQQEAERAHEQRVQAEADRTRALGEAVAALWSAARELTDRSLNLAAATDARIHAAAIELSELILAAELRDTADSARAALRRALAAVDVREVQEIRVNPGDLATLTEAQPDLPAVTLVADPALRPGDAVATVTDGAVDARIAEALDRARRALEEAAE